MQYVCQCAWVRCTFSVSVAVISVSVHVCRCGVWMDVRVYGWVGCTTGSEICPKPARLSHGVSIFVFSARPKTSGSTRSSSAAARLRHGMGAYSLILLQAIKIRIIINFSSLQCQDFKFLLVHACSCVRVCACVLFCRPKTTGLKSSAGLSCTSIPVAAVRLDSAQRLISLAPVKDKRVPKRRPTQVSFPHFIWLDRSICLSNILKMESQVPT